MAPTITGSHKCARWPDSVAALQQSTAPAVCGRLRGGLGWASAGHLCSHLATRRRGGPPSSGPPACPSSVEPLAPVALIESVATIVPESRCQQAAGRFSIATYPPPVHFELLPSVALIESAGHRSPVIFLPAGGGTLHSETERLAACPSPEHSVNIQNSKLRAFGTFAKQKPRPRRRPGLSWNHNATASCRRWRGGQGGSPRFFSRKSLSLTTRSGGNLTTNAMIISVMSKI
jgi:hypothetical protein